MIMLWKGRLSLARAFWEYAVIYGAIVSLVATGLAFAAVAMDAPIWVAAAIYALPVPYFIAAVVGVWRSARTYPGPVHWANRARGAVVVWAILMILL